MDESDDKLAIAAEKLRIALELNESGFEMKRQQFRRRFPDDNEAEIDERFRAWLKERPGAEHGDGIGRPGVWPRKPR